MFRILGTATLVIVVSTADATITADHFLWASGRLPESDFEFFTYRVQVHVSTTPGHADDDDWTAAGLDASLTGGVFYQDPHNGHNPPNPDFFAAWPDLEYDSYYTSPGNYPNTDYDGTFVSFDPWDTDTRLGADWFDTVDTGNGDFVIAQFTVLPDEPDWVVTGLLLYAAADTGGQLFEYAFTIPEPGVLALLTVGVLAVVRRRR
jgi:hypothetical protein